MVIYSAHPQVEVPCSSEETEVEKTLESGLYKNLDKFIEVRPHSAEKSGKQAPDLVSVDRFRIHGPLYTEADQITALAFYMDRGLTYIPANNAGFSLFQASACATFDSALRIPTHGVGLRTWHISERQTCGAGNARALSEGRVFDAKGHLLASVTQKTIL